VKSYDGDIYCKSCGKGMCHNADIDIDGTMFIKPCDCSSIAVLPKADGYAMLADVRVISQGWLAEIVHQITQCPKGERRIWEKALEISEENYNKLSEHFR